MPTVAVWLTEPVYRTWLRWAEERATTTSEIAKRVMTNLAEPGGAFVRGTQRERLMEVHRE